MLSESRAGIVPESAEAPNTTSKTKERDRRDIAKQTAEYLSSGGVVNVLGTSFGDTKMINFNMGTAKVRAAAGYVERNTIRKEVDGVSMIRKLVVANKLGTSPNNVNKKIRNYGFPKPVGSGRNTWWVESEVDAWIEKESQALAAKGGADGKEASHQS